MYDLTRPIRFVIKGFVGLISKQVGGASNESNKLNPILRESDFLMMVEEGHKEGAIQENEFELIKNVFELDDTAVADVFTPLSQVQSVTEYTTLKSALATLRALQFSRIPVIAASNKKAVIGILYSKDLLRARLQPDLLAHTVTSIMRKPIFVNPSVRLNALFRKFKQQKNHMAVVQEMPGNVLGIVTMSDVLDALFDDILPDPDEYGDDDGVYQPPGRSRREVLK